MANDEAGGDRPVGDDPNASHPNALLLKRWLEDGWGAGNVDLADELFHEDFIGHDNPPVEGLETLKMAIRASRGAFSTVEFLYDRFIVEADRIGVAFTVRGHHVRPFLGIPASGRETEFFGTVIFRVVDGRFKEGWQTIDVSRMIREAGLPAAVPGAAPDPSLVPAWATRWALGPRYVRVARLIIDGLSDGEIALHTGLSTGTIRTYVREVLRAAGVHSRIDLGRACGEAVVG